jgi:hypothetical protein
MDVQVLINTLADQRNIALNQVAELTAQLATANEKISTLEHPEKPD